MNYRNLIWVCLLGVAMLAGQANAQFQDPRVLGGPFIRDLEPIYPNQEEVAPSGVKVAQSGLIFLSFPVDARRGAMADAGVGLLGDGPGAVFLNPALLGYVHEKEVFVSHVEWIAETKHTTAGLIFQFNNVPGTFALGGITHDSGDINGTAIDANPLSVGFRETSTFSTTDWAFSGGYGVQITDRFSVGANLRYATQDLNVESVSAISIDIGTYFNTGFRNAAIAMSVRNFSEEKEFLRERFELPRAFRLGAVIDVISMWGNTPVPHHFDFLAELDSPIDFDERWLFGAEYRFKRPDQSLGFALRGGYKVNHDTEDFSLGAGVSFQTEGGAGVRADYAYKNFDGAFFDPVQMVTFAVSF